MITEIVTENIPRKVESDSSLPSLKVIYTKENQRQENISWKK